MNPLLKTSSVAAAVLATTLAGSAAAWADGGNRHSDRHGHRNQHHGQHYDRHHKPKGYHRGYPRSYGRHYKKHDDDDEEKLLIGLLVGGLVGYVVGNQQPAHDYGSSAYPPAGIQPQSEVYAAPQYNYAPGGTRCLQQREYQSKVIVGGKPVDAYGTACLQPDGSWHRGPAQLVSY